MPAVQVAASLNNPIETLEKSALRMGVELTDADKAWLQGRTRFFTEEDAAGVALNLSQIGYISYQDGFSALLRKLREPEALFDPNKPVETVEELVASLVEDEQILTYAISALHHASERTLFCPKAQQQFFEAMTWARLGVSAIAEFATFETHPNWNFKHRTRDWNSESNLALAAQLMESLAVAETPTEENYRLPHNRMARSFKSFGARYRTGELSGEPAAKVLRALNDRLRTRLDAIRGDYTVGNSFYLSGISGAILPITVQASEDGDEDVQMVCIENMGDILSCMRIPKPNN